MVGGCRWGVVRSWSPRGWVVGVLAAACALCGWLAMTGSAQAVAIAVTPTWTGQTPTSGNGAALLWSTASNWSNGVTPTNGSNGSLDFPSLGSSCPSGDACLTSNNDLTNVSVTGLQIGDNYNIGGNPITVGSGGLNLASTTSVSLQLPIVLGAAQTWTAAGSSLNVSQPLTAASSGATDSLGIHLTGNGSVSLNGDNEVGPLTISGTGQITGGNHLYTGLNANLNATNAQPVNVTSGAILTPGPGTTLGPLAVTGGGIGINSGTQVLTVDGAASLDSSSGLYTALNNATASDLSATGSVSVGGNLTLTWAYTGGNCAALTPDTVYTLVQGSSLTGSFANAPSGANIAISCADSASGYRAVNRGTVRIDYTSTSVTATVLRPTTTTLQAPSPTNPDTNQTVTLNATVTGSGSPTGTVSFDNNGVAISGCAAQAVNASTGVATCSTSFTAASSPESLTAVYSPAAGTNYQTSSTSSATALTVGKDATSTTLGTSDASPVTGEQVTYTATITPNDSGSAAPGGTVSFKDGGNAITGCTASSVSAGQATCQVTYNTPGNHTITAAYNGDANFSTSSSPTAGQSETVTQGPISTTTSAVTASPSSPHTNQTVTLSTTISSGTGTPTGTVEFDNNGVAISGCAAQAVNASTGVATCSTSFTAASSPESLTAVYSPAAGTNYQTSSTSSATALTVGKDATSTTLGTSDASPVTGEQVTYTATITPNDSGSAAPGGTVSFKDGGNAITGCTASSVSAGQATCQVTYNTPGNHTITAAYNGDANFSTSSSPTAGQSETVTQGPISTTTSAVTASPSSPHTNQTATLSTTISSGTGTPTGTVEFDNNGVAISGCAAQAVNASTGVATCSTSFTAASSPESLTAVYSPAAGTNYQTSSTSSATAADRGQRRDQHRPAELQRQPEHRRAGHLYRHRGPQRQRSEQAVRFGQLPR